MGIHQENNDLSGIKALVVDDNQFHAEFIREMLEDAKATVVLAFSGEEALAVLEKMHDFSCVIMDTLMPGMDGFATAERIRRMASPELHVLPIIGMLSHKNKDDHEKVFAIGMNGVLTKPISPTKLYEEVNRLHHNTFLAQHGNRESLKGLSAYVLVRDRGVCDAIGQHLEDNGLQVVRYYELKDVLDMANENRRYDFAFVEWDDSAEDGSELARQVTLFAQNTFKHLIAVIKDWSTIESQALGLGIDAYINTSPTRMETLNVLQKVMHDDELKAKQTSEDFKGVRILIADDNVTNAMIMQNAMEAFGATADIAQSGSEAFEKLKNAPEKYYQMAFLDIFMPDMKGFEVAEQFRKLERGDAFTLPLIGISGNSGTQLVEQAIASGMNAMMLKPITRKSQLAYMNIFLKEENYSKVLASRMHKRLNEINKDLSVSKYKADIVSYLVNHHDLKEIINYTAEHLLAIAGCRRVLMYYEEGGQCHEWCAQGVSSCPVMLSCGALHASDGEYECRCGGKSYIREINVGGKLFGRLAVQYGEQSRALGEQLLHEASGIVTMAVERSIAEKNQQNMMAMLEERSLETQSANELILGMLNSIPIPFFVKDIKDDFRYLMCNDAYVAAISKAKEDIIGHTDSELFSQKMGTKIREDDLTAVNSANRFLKKFNVNDQWIWSNGRIYDETKQLFTDKNDRRLLLCTAEDVTDAKYEIVRAKFKSDITTFLSKNVDCDEILEYVALQLREVTDCDFIVLHCADGSHREWAKDGSHWTCDYCGQCFFVNSQGPQFDAEHIAEVTDISHVAGAKVPAKCRAHAIMSHQIMFQEKVWGQLAIHYAKECQAFPKSMRNLLQIAADVMTSTLEREEYITHIKMERDNAIAAEKAKNFFFATVSHDIRTPLNSIVGFSELLKRGEDDPKVRENYLDAIMVSSKKLESLITDVLDISKLEADKMKFFYEMIELSKLFDSVCVIFEQKAREKGIALTIECKDIPVVSIDQHRVRQILLNLVGNAVKYTEKGSVSIRASFERKNESIGELTVAVADTGIGIQKEDLENVMKPFAQLRKSDQVDGTGLGLTVCYQLLKRMNGEMSIESTVGKGSVLTMVLHDVPYKMEERKNEVEVKAGSVSQETTVPLNYETVKLLLVDDSKLNLMVLQKMCVKMGFKEIAMAEDGLKALEVMEAQPIDIVLTDIRMPNMRGEELVAKIRQDERFKNLPVFAVTAEVDALRTYSQAGFTGILLKPLNIDKINGCLDAVMKGEPVALE